LVQNHGWTLLAMVLTGAAVLWMLWRNPPGFFRTPRGRRLVPGLALRDQYLAGQFMGILGTLLRGGVPVTAAMPLAAGALSSATWRAALLKVEHQVREGSRLTGALDQVQLVPSAAIRLIEVGERSGALGDACAHASEVIAQSARSSLDRIITLANPIAIILLGGLVGSLVAGVMLGIFAIGEIAG
jgi:general secretion pathway protein F